MAIDLDRAVLLPIDMQQAFDTPPWPRRWNKNVDANGLALLAAWRSAGRPIIHVRHDSVQPGSSLAPGARGNAFRPGFEPQGDEPLVSKSVNSAFIGTDLDLRLKRLGAKHVVVFGISPRCRRAILAASLSTQVTTWPKSAKHAPETRPT